MHVRTTRRRDPVRETGPVVVLMVLALVLASCVGPALSEQNYLGKAISSLERDASALGAMELGARQYVAGRIQTPVLDVLVSSKEEEVGYVHKAFASRQPASPEQDDLRRETTHLLEEVTALAADLRIAVRREDVPTVRTLVDELAALREEVETRRRALDGAP